MIVKTGKSQYTLFGKSKRCRSVGGKTVCKRRVLGRFSSMAAAGRRERQVQFFKRR